MKNFLEHLTESAKTYEFRIKICNIDPAEDLARLKAALDAYGLKTLSEIKRLPIVDHSIDFPSQPNCQVYLLDAVLTYPVNNDQLRAIVGERAAIPLANIVVVPTNHPEELWRNNEGELREFKQGESVLDKDELEDTPEAKAAGKAYSEAGSFMKELHSAKWEIAGNEKADGKTTNDLPQNNQSPIKGTK